MLKTTDYDQFKFRNDNRDGGIDQVHLRKIIQSIKSLNLLEFRPICVNEAMEVIDGQHRLMAAKELGLEIYYQVKKDFNSKDIILMNIAKAWTTSDYLNYYCKNGNENYIKLKEFMVKHKIGLKIAYNITSGLNKESFIDFKQGDYVFNEECYHVNIGLCWETIYEIRKVNGYSPYTNSARFWKALITLVQHPEFVPQKWMVNVQKMITRFGSRVSTKDYLRLIMDVYNWYNKDRINLFSGQDF